MLTTVMKPPTDWHVVEPKPDHLIWREHAVTNGLAQQTGLALASQVIENK